jgi:hypothetical protein
MMAQNTEELSQLHSKQFEQRDEKDGREIAI